MYAAPNRRRTGKDEIRLKAKAVRAAQRRLAQLQAENDWLRWQHQLIVQLCKGFDWFRNLKLKSLLADPQLMQVNSEQLTPESLQQQLSSSCLATEDETRLLQQLPALPDVQLQSSMEGVAGLALDGSNPSQERSCSSSPRANSSQHNYPASSNSEQQPIAPPDDPLFLFQHVFSQDPPASCSSLETLTLQDLQTHYKSLVRDLSLYLMQLQTGGMAAQEQPLEKIQAALVDHMRLLAELCIANGALVTSLQLSNSDTGEELSEPPTERIRWVVERLQLSPQQQYGIARGMAVCKKLQTPVLEELRQLQQQINECPSSCSSERSSEAGDDKAGSHTADAAQQYSIDGPRGRVLEQQERRSGRMKMLLHKDYFLRTWFSGYLYGQLSWLQLARMQVLMYPYFPVPFVFFKEVAAQVTARLTQHADDEDGKADDNDDNDEDRKPEGSHE